MADETKQEVIEKGFDPRPYMITLGKKQYLGVAPRIVLFREKCPVEESWAIVTELVEGGFAEGFAVFKASVINPHGVVVSMGYKTEDRQGFSEFYEKAETGAVGRALAAAGFGTIYAQEMDEGDKICDSPQGPAPEIKAPWTPKPPAPATTDATKCTGPGCARPLTAGVLATSIRIYKKPLCMQCQGEESKAKAAANKEAQGD